MDGTETPATGSRSESFGYICHRCLKCCHHKQIQLNPYEIARLARNRGVTTGEFRDRWTQQGAGTFLAQTETGACVFLGADGCTVHQDRPLVCRLYPLGRHLTAEGAESFSYSKTHPQSSGEFTRSGTIASFLDKQGAIPFMQAADDYFFWLCALGRSVDEVCTNDPADLSAEDNGSARNLLDMDGAIFRHCAAMNIEEPADIEERRKLHLDILYQQLEPQGSAT